MDMFMDKLAQKLTAQEIIKANTVAETEELNQLRSQVKEYNACLTKLQRLIDEGAVRLSGAQAEERSEINRLVEESINKIKSLQKESAGLERLQKELNRKLEGTDAELAAKLNSMNQSVTEKLSAMDKTFSEQTGALKEAFTGRLDLLEEKLGSEQDGQLSERLAETDENVHKECVKVYRNVQAVVVEENAKQKQAVDGVAEAVTSWGGKLGVILGVSIAALVFSLVSTILQILSALNINVF